MAGGWRIGAHVAGTTPGVVFAYNGPLVLAVNVAVDKCRERPVLYLENAARLESTNLVVADAEHRLQAGGRGRDPRPKRRKPELAAAFSPHRRHGRAGGKTNGIRGKVGLREATPERDAKERPRISHLMSGFTFPTSQWVRPG